MTCIKAPKLTTLKDYNGDYFTYEKIIYDLFSKDFIDKDIFFRGQKVSHKFMPSHKNMLGTFWHIVSNGSDEDNRTPNLRRYETIEYPAFIIEHCVDKCPTILIWENERKKKKRILIYCTTLRYLVVLDKRSTYLLFWTAYPVDQSHTHKKLLKEYEEYKARSAIQINE